MAALRPRSLLLRHALALLGALLLSVDLVVPVVAGAKARAGGKLPSCDAARTHYKNGNLYRVLGVPKTAGAKEIRRAFKKMSVQCHPDKDHGNRHASDNFIAVAGAYETLSDERERRKYDMFGGTGGSGSEGGGFGGTGGGGGGFDFNWQPKEFQDIDVNDILRRFGSAFSFEEDDFGFSDMFKSFASAGGNSGAGKAGKRAKAARKPGGFAFEGLDLGFDLDMDFGDWLHDPATVDTTHGSEFAKATKTSRAKRRRRAASPDPMESRVNSMSSDPNELQDALKSILNRFNDITDEFHDKLGGGTRRSRRAKRGAKRKTEL